MHRRASCDGIGRPRRGGRHAYGRRMRTELPAERLHRRLGAEPDTAANGDPRRRVESGRAADEDQNSLLPRWLPGAPEDRGWAARVRADPGRAGAIGLAIVAALAVLITVFTLMRERPTPVMSAKLPPVERASTARRGRRPAGPGQPGAPEWPVVVSVVGLVHTPGLVTLAPGARIADALQAAGGSVDGADTIGLNMARPLGDGEQIVVGLAPAPGRPASAGQFGRPGLGAAVEDARAGTRVRARRPRPTGASTSTPRPWSSSTPCPGWDRSPRPRSWRGGRPTAGSPASTNWVTSTASVRRGWTNCAPGPCLTRVHQTGCGGRVIGAGGRAPGAFCAYLLGGDRGGHLVAGRAPGGVVLRRAGRRCRFARLMRGASAGSGARLSSDRRGPGVGRRGGGRLRVRGRAARRRGGPPPDHRGRRHGCGR